MLLLSALVACALAHNWLNSPGRSGEFASTVFPAIPSQTGQPHVQVAAGQPFLIEWVVGHDGDAYFVLLENNKQAFSNMLQHKTAALDDYLNNSPTPSNTTNTMWQKYHRKYNDVTLNASGNDSVFTKCLRSNEAGYLPRPVVWRGSFSGAPSSSKRNVTMMTHCFYKQNLVGTMFDRRAEYTNPKYPWIISAHRYRYFANTPSRGDFAEFRFPKGTKPGMYIVHWGWRGYYDIVDVEVVAGADVALPYGAEPPVRPANTPSEYRRVDHCTFLEPILAGSCRKMITDAKTCMQTCDRMTDFGCQAVAVVPVINPPTVYEKFRIGPGNVSLVPNTPQCNRKTIMTGARVGDLACFPLQQRPKDPLLPEDAYLITNDPDDPAYYSTCFFRVKLQNLSTPAPPPPPRDLLWQSHYKCVDCAEARKAQFEHYIPLWNVSNTCQNCEVDGPASVPTPTNYSAPIPWTKNGGYQCLDKSDPKTQYTCVNTTTCSISLGFVGTSGDMSFRDCYQMAKSNPKCGRIVWMTTPYQNDPARCNCWTNHTAANACCGGCVGSGNNAYYANFLLEQQPPF